MKEAELRKWHRYMGITLAIFLILQAGSGLLISLGHLTIPHSHAHSEVAGPHENRYEHTKQKDHSHGEPIPSMHQKAKQRPLSQTIGAIHHGGGFIGTLYRILLGVGVLGQTIMGGFIFFKMQQRSKSRRSMTS